MKCKLNDICSFANEKIDVALLSKTSYISTENMLPNKAGITTATSLPTVNQTQAFKSNDVLISNIRPYFKKIWYATFDGGCSNDVLVLRANADIDPHYLYYLLADDVFFDYATATAKGTKMPRGDKAAIMKFEVNVYDIAVQRKIVSLLADIDAKIALNNAINCNLEQQAQALFKSWFVDFEPFGGNMPSHWGKSTLGEVSDMSAGGDKPEIISASRTEKTTIPIFSNGLSDEGLYGYTDKARITEESVTVSARGTIGYVCLRQEPFVPIVRLVTLVPHNNVVSAKYLYLWLKNLHIAGTGTTQQQLTVPDFKKTEILIPDIETVRRFTEIVNPMYLLLYSNKEENTRLSTLRDTLLPKLMNGEIDVSEVEI